jgi:hypothetical protein
MRKSWISLKLSKARESGKNSRITQGQAMQKSKYDSEAKGDYMIDVDNPGEA